MYRITKKELIKECTNLLKMGYTRCINDTGYRKEGMSIQEYFSDLTGQQITKSEVNSWFKLPELKGLRINTSNYVLIVEEDGSIADLEYDTDIEESVEESVEKLTTGTVIDAAGSEKDIDTEDTMGVNTKDSSTLVPEMKDEEEEDEDEEGLGW